MHLDTASARNVRLTHTPFVSSELPRAINDITSCGVPIGLADTMKDDTERTIIFSHSGNKCNAPWDTGAWNNMASDAQWPNFGIQ